MNHQLRYALIGCGRISPNHMAAALANADQLNIAALCDIAPKQMEEALAHLPREKRETVRCYTNHRQMLLEIKPHLCAVATESGCHASIGLDVMEAGSHVIIEKPLALSMQDGRALVEAAKREGVKLCVCHQNRFNKSIQKIRSAVEDERFGKMLYGTAHVRWFRNEEYYKQAPWRGTWEQDGGALMNQCIHSVDLLRWMMGDDVSEVFAYTDNLAHSFIQTEDLGLALIRFHSGAYGLVEGTTSVYPHNLEETLYLFGRDGTVKAGGKSVNVIEEWDFRDGRGDPATIKMQFAENPPNVYGFGHTPLYTNMINSIIQNREPYITGEAGLRALELVLAIYRSAAEHRPVKLPLENCATIDFAGRFGR